MRLLLLLALATPPGRVIVYRADLTPITGGYPAIVDGPVLCGDRVLERGTGYWINGDVMRVECAPPLRVSTYLAAWVEVGTLPGVERRKP